MDVFITGKSCKGVKHVKKGIPCQDSFLTKRTENYIMLSVADGVGSKKCKYSHIGSQKAVEVFCSTIDKLINYYGSGEKLYQYLSVNINGELKKIICDNWRKKLRFQKPYLVRKDKKLTLFATTLLGILITPDFYLSIQIGDGDILSVTRDGKTTRVIEYEKFLGTETYSLSDKNAHAEMHAKITDFSDVKNDNPVLFMLSTDGLANSFASDDDFKKCGIDYLRLIQEHGTSVITNNLEKWLLETTNEGSGDDITLAMAYLKNRQ